MKKVKPTYEELENRCRRAEAALETLRADQAAESALGERIKELKCLYELARIVEQKHITIEGILEQAAALLPPSMRFPQSAVGRIRWKDRVFETGDWKTCESSLAVALYVLDQQVGWVNVGYPESAFSADEEPFRKEERLRIEAVAERIGRIIERKQAEEALRDSEERFRLFMDFSPPLAWIKDEDGRYVYLSRKHSDYFGVPAEDWLGKTVQDLLPAETASLFQQNDLRVLEGHHPMEFVEEVATPSGKYRFFQVHKIPFQNARGKRYVGGIGLDITDRKQAEEKLKESEQKFSAAFMSSPAILIITTMDEGRYVEVNQAFTEFMGYTKEEAIGKTSLELGTWYSPDRRSELIEQFKRNGFVRNAEIKIRTKSGDIRTGLISTQKVILEGEGYFLSQIFDITDQRKAEARLQESEERYRRLTENARDIIWRTDHKGKMVFLNSAVENLLGYTRKEAVGLNISDYMDRNSVDRLREKLFCLQPEIHHSQDHFVTEVDYITKNGETAPFEISVVVLRDTDGTVVGYEGISRDITDRKQMERDLIKARENAEAADRAKSEFIANMSHELRTPLNAILGYSQILGRDQSLSESNRQKISVIKNSGEHLLILINDILDIARIEAGKIDLDPQSTELRPLISNTADMVRVKAFQKKLQFHSEIDTSLPRFIQVDEKRLRQVLLNLLSNAVKFTEQGEITLRVRTEGDKIAFSVTDTGVGIPEDKRSDIFEAFQQLNPADSKTEGTGLGLTISRNLIWQMGGRITVKSPAGRGSTFRFEIPLYDAGGGRTKSSQQSGLISGYEGKRRKMLIVDDFDLNRQVVRAMIEPLGFEIEEASDGQDAVARAEAFRPDLILMDWVLPGFGGREAIRRIRAFEGRYHPVIIVITGHTDAQTRQEIQKSGAADCSCKPISQEELLSKIEHHLKLSWKYEKPKESAAKEGATEMPKRTPSKTDIESLYAMSRMGNLSGICAHVKHMRRTDPKMGPFCRQVEILAQDCDITAIRNFIQKCTGKKS